MKRQDMTRARLLEALEAAERRIAELESREGSGRGPAADAQAREERYRHFFNLPQLGIAIIRPDGHWIEIGDEVCRILQYSREELRGVRWQDLTPPEELEEDLSWIRNILDGEDPAVIAEKRLIRKDGSLLDVQLSLTPVRSEEGAVDSLVAVIRDITGSRQAERLIGIQKELALALMKTTSIEEAAKACMDACIEATQCDSGGIYFIDEGTGAVNLVHVREVSETFADRSRHFAASSELTQIVLEGRILYLGARDLQHLVNAHELAAEGIRSAGIVPIWHEDRVIGSLNLGSHVHEQLSEQDRQALEVIALQIGPAIARLMAGQRVRESEELFRLVFERADDAHLLIRDGRFIDCNDAALRITGYPGKSHLQRMEWTDILPNRQPDGSLSSEKMKQMVEIAERNGSHRFEWVVRRSDGEEYWLDAMLTSVMFKGMRLVLATWRDNTERRKLHERLARAERMESLGTLAGGVAHDLNNVLGVLVGYAELLLGKLPEDSPLRRYAGNILNSGEKGAAIIQDLLTLARRGVAVTEVLDLNGIVRACLKSPELDKLKGGRPGVTIRAELDDALLTIKGSPNHLAKTVTNLLSFTMESISGEGEVTIRTGSRYVDRPLPGHDRMVEGDYTVLSVSDTGRGIAAADLGKIFEPFYTKKAMGMSGTGLGLPVVWGTVKDHAGFIDVASTEGQGSTFTLYFPVTREEMAEKPPDALPEEYRGRGETILVVDDVEGQRDLAVSMLGQLNYRVQAVSSGEEAVEYIRKHPVDLLVLDMIMAPGIDGLETYRRILEINPGQKAIIVSGYSETDRLRKVLEIGAGAHVRKPYTQERIGSAIRRELSRRPNT